jgi:methyl-accepting chemotaxis protein
MQDSMQSKERIGEIVEFVERQQEAIENINQNLKDISYMVENNTQSAVENTSISQQLGDCAKSLMETAESFSLR